jgi:hypothetical protein
MSKVISITMNSSTDNYFDTLSLEVIICLQLLIDLRDQVYRWFVNYLVGNTYYKNRAVIEKR